MTFNYSLFCISLESSIREAIDSIDKNQKGIVLLIDKERRLVGTITDGDIRRAMLVGQNLDSNVKELLARKGQSPYAKPVTASAETDHATLMQMMKKFMVRQIPLVDKNSRIVGLVTMEDLLPDQTLPLKAVVMAGGFGTRLQPLTDELPKPMLPVNGRPLMERIIGQLRKAGIRSVNITTHYKPEKITEHFGDGHSFGVELNYVSEQKPLGTGGALGLIPVPEEPLLVINGDILTQVDFRSMLSFHQEQHALMTVAVRRYELKVPYGVVECTGSYISSLKEKPQVGFLVNAGIYLLEPAVYQFIPNGEHFNMTDLIQWLLKAGKPVVTFPIREYWLDIGQHEDYIQAQADFKNGRFPFELEKQESSSNRC
jgi:dTDP-glucose pyrophosphorylase